MLCRGLWSLQVQHFMVTYLEHLQMLEYCLQHYTCSKKARWSQRIHANSALKQPIQSAGMSATFTQPLSWSAFKSLPYYRWEGHELDPLERCSGNMIHDSFKFVRRLIQKYPEIFFGKQLVKLSTLTNPLTNPLKRQRTSTYNEFLWIPVFPAMSPLQWVSLFRKPIDVPMFLQDEVNCVGAAVTASLCPLSHELIPWDFTVRPKPPHPRARYSGHFWKREVEIYMWVMWGIYIYIIWMKLNNKYQIDGHPCHHQEWKLR